MTDTLPCAPAPTGTRNDPVPLSWRLIRSGRLPGARNMAIDHALAAGLAPGSGVLRLYGWARPTVSFGRNERSAGLYSVRAARERGIDLVRRPTGGRAVLHDVELTYAVVAPARAFGGARAAYRRINAALAGALGSLGAPVELSADGEAVGLEAGPCFGRAVAGEVVSGGRKLVGSAQARIGGALLQHGSILVGGEQARLDGLRGQPRETVDSITLQELVGPVDGGALERAVGHALEAGLGGRWASGELFASEVSEAERLERERYGLDSWTWRR